MGERKVLNKYFPPVSKAFCAAACVCAPQGNAAAQHLDTHTSASPTSPLQHRTSIRQRCPAPRKCAARTNR